MEIDKLKRIFRCAIIILIAHLIYTNGFQKTAVAFPHATTSIYNDCVWKYDNVYNHYVTFVAGNIKCVSPGDWSVIDRSRQIKKIIITITGYTNGWTQSHSDPSWTKVVSSGFYPGGISASEVEITVPNLSYYDGFSSRLEITDTGGNQEDVSSYLYPTTTPNAYPKASNISISNYRYTDSSSIMWYKGGDTAKFVSIIDKHPYSIYSYHGKPVPVTSYNDVVELNRLILAENDKSWIHGDCDDTIAGFTSGYWENDRHSWDVAGILNGSTISAYPVDGDVNRKLDVTTKFIDNLNAIYYVRQQGDVRKCLSPHDEYPGIKDLYGDGYYLEPDYSKDSPRIGIDSLAPTATGVIAEQPSQDSLRLQVNDVIDPGTGSGVDDDSIISYIWKVGESYRTKIKMYRIAGTNNFQATLDLSKGDNAGKYGTFNVEAYGSDNVTNNGLIAKTSFGRFRVVNDWTKVSNSPYYNNGEYWVKTNTDFDISVCGHVEGDTNYRISRSYALDFNQDGKHNHPSFFIKTDDQQSSSKFGLDTDVGASGYIGVDVKSGSSQRITTLVTTKFVESIALDNQTETYYPFFRTYVNGNIAASETSGNPITGSSPWQEDSKKVIVHSDGVAPRVYKSSFSGTLSFKIKDLESGLYTVKIVDSSGTTLATITNDKAKSKVSEYSYLMPDSKELSATITAVDNVGNQTIYRLENHPVKTSLLINNLDPSTSNVGTNGVLSGSRRMLKVDASASGGITFECNEFGVGKLWVPNYRLYSTGVPGTTILGDNKGSLSISKLIDDTTNSPFGPTMHYAPSDYNSVLSWDPMQDPFMNYTFTLKGLMKSSDATYTTLEDTVPTINNPVKFASGYKNFNMKLYRTSGNGVMPTTNPLVDKTMDFYSLNMNMYSSGWYYAECTMYDFNGNPSGTTKFWFNHVQPAVFTDLNLTVTAVKDVDWEGANYPFKFGYGIADGSSENVDYSHGYDYDKFPLGGAYKFNNKNIALGYAINYNIVKENVNQLDKLEIRYKFIGSKGQLLTAKKDGSDLNDCDRDNGTHYCSKVLSKTDLKLINSGSPIYLKHFIPVNTTFYDNSGAVYTGFVEVDVDFISTKLLKTFTREIRLYTTTTQETALDDVDSSKQR